MHESIHFVRHMALFGPFSEGNHLQDTWNWHTMASMLFEKDTPLSAVSDILGHMDTDYTAVYLKVDMKN